MQIKLKHEERERFIDEMEERETFPDCYGCGELLYDEEAYTDTDGERICANCVAATLSDALMVKEYDVTAICNDKTGALLIKVVLR